MSNSVVQHKVKENNIIAFNNYPKAQRIKFWVICCKTVRQRRLKKTDKKKKF